jgi:Protein of unknown function (DUF3034)
MPTPANPLHAGCKSVKPVTACCHRVLGAVALLVALSHGSPVMASGRLAATGGLAEVDGAGGGGLTPWALIAGLGTDEEIGGSAHCTGIRPQDFKIVTCGLAVGIHDRFEISVATLHLSLGEVVPGQAIEESVVGLKYRIAGEAVIDQDRWMPEVSVGVFLRHNHDFEPVARSLGARRATGGDVYLSATKLIIAGPFSRTWALNATARLSNANQFGLLGFGGDSGNYRLLAEISAVSFITDHIAAGIEFRQKPDNLTAVREDGAGAVVVSLIPNKHFTVTTGYVDLGHIAGRRVQRGLYVSLQGAW